ncbi:MAG TPA: efflux transporter periplasmic adaptor subunit, partial [Oligoflexia bacterium]|nr:efflux transporter periplasmic adaptor subunit [Oligoflexia bacterium]
AILIPQQSVMRDPKGNPQVLVVDANGSAQVKMLELDRAVGDQWVVSSGLTLGERIIVEGAQRIRPGTPVKEVPFTPGSKDAAQSEDKPPVEQKQN